MRSPISGSDAPALIMLTFILLLSAAAMPTPTTTAAAAATTTSTSVNSNSILVALLDSHYTELAELIEKALLLPTLEAAVGRHNLTILAPRNDALDRSLDPSFKRFLLQPSNLPSLQSLLLFHILPLRLPSASLLPLSSPLPTLSASPLSPSDLAPSSISHPDAVLRPDGIIHGISRLLVPHSVELSFNSRRSTAEISAVLPTGAPEVDPRTHRLRRPAPPAPAGAPPALPIYDALAPGPAIAPAPAPGPGAGTPRFDGEGQVKDFIQTLLLYGGYNEFADILVNLTSLATEMGRLVSEGYVLTVLVPNDAAMAKLTADQLSEPGAPERIVYYHLIPEYQTEESMYNAVRRFGRVRYDTLRVPHKMTAREADGTVKFGEGEGFAYLYDPDIYTDGRISVQGIDTVIFPPDEEPTSTGVAPAALTRKPPAATKKPRRGKLMEVGCQLLGALGLRSCH